MKKFILQEKGSKSLRAIEKKQQLSYSYVRKKRTRIVIYGYREYDKQRLWNVKCSRGKKGFGFQRRVYGIVNAANSELQHVGGLVRAIVTAGDREIQSQCKEYIQDKGDLLEGQTMITSAGALPCDKVIHTVGPRWISWESQGKCSLMEQRLHFFQKKRAKITLQTNKPVFLLTLLVYDFFVAAA